MARFRLYNEDCFKAMGRIRTGSIDAIICDPPYGMIKDAKLIKKNTAWDVRLDTERMFNECERLLKHNGALVLFCQEPYTSHLLNNQNTNLPFSHKLYWNKNHFGNPLSCKKLPASVIEEICVFTKAHDSHKKHPLRAYARQVFEHIGKTKAEIHQTLGHFAAAQFFQFEQIQFGLCTHKTYEQLIALFNIDKMPGFRPFESLTMENDHYKQTRARTFNLPKGKRHKPNLLRYAKDTSKHHPTQKPVELMLDLVETYSKRGHKVLDFTMGSGSTGVACRRAGRQFIGIERDGVYFSVAKKRILQHS